MPFVLAVGAITSFSSSCPFPSTLGTVPTLDGVGFFRHSDRVDLGFGPGIDGFDDERPRSVGKATLLLPRAVSGPFGIIRAKSSRDPNYLMHAATSIAVFARIVEVIEANIWVHFVAPSFATFSALPSFPAFATTTRCCVGLGWVALHDINDDWAISCPSLVAGAHQMAVLGGKIVFQLVPGRNGILEFNLPK